MSDDISQSLAEAVRAAAAAGRSLAIRGGGSKDFYGREAAGEPLEVGGHRGIVSYEPTELVVTARGGTPLAELEAALAARGQMLGCEPPRFGPGTVGGMVAAGLSGPRRPYAGSVRDFVLGAKLLNGKGEVLRFGGQVMKNVAGYDVSRLQAGALGAFGVLLELSLKVLPVPQAELTLVQPRPLLEAVEVFNRWAGQPLPLSATAWVDGRACIRLSGAAAAVRVAAETLGGERLDGEAAGAFWAGLREQTDAFFDGLAPLWRLSLPPAAQQPALPGGTWLLEWGGAQRWWRGEAAPETVFAAARAAGGHAACFRGGGRAGEVFQPLAPALMRVHRELKRAFDPQRVFNPGRLYADL